MREIKFQFFILILLKLTKLILTTTTIIPISSIIPTIGKYWTETETITGLINCNWNCCYSVNVASYELKVRCEKHNPIVEMSKCGSFHWWTLLKWKTRIEGALLCSRMKRSEFSRQFRKEILLNFLKTTNHRTSVNVFNKNIISMYQKWQNQNYNRNSTKFHWWSLGLRYLWRTTSTGADQW